MPDYKKLYFEIMGKLADIADIAVDTLRYGEDVHINDETYGDAESENVREPNCGTSVQ